MALREGKKNQFPRELKQDLKEIEECSLSWMAKSQVAGGQKKTISSEIEARFERNQRIFAILDSKKPSCWPFGQAKKSIPQGIEARFEGNRRIFAILDSKKSSFGEIEESLLSWIAKSQVLGWGSK